VVRPAGPTWAAALPLLGPAGPFGPWGGWQLPPHGPPFRVRPIRVCSLLLKINHILYIISFN
jgi:hypothetical protein